MIKIILLSSLLLIFSCAVSDKTGVDSKNIKASSANFYDDNYESETENEKKDFVQEDKNIEIEGIKLVFLDDPNSQVEEKVEEKVEEVSQCLEQKELNPPRGSVYIVKKGDCLSTISEQLYDNRSKLWPYIWNNNKMSCSNLRDIAIGTSIYYLPLTNEVLAKYGYSPLKE